LHKQAVASLEPTGAVALAPHSAHASLLTWFLNEPAAHGAQASLYPIISF
jgi:hypothetical protein